MATDQLNNGSLMTRVLPIKTTNLGRFETQESLEKWTVPSDVAVLAPLKEAAQNIKHTVIPVAFPTETVYGLGADATRSDAVKGIYMAKGRPSDNPLIVHICDLRMLRSLLSPKYEETGGNETECIPTIYLPLIQKFWPGPLTILLSNLSSSGLAPEVTAGLPTFGARMPSSALALSLISLAGVPIAAPSANASTKPSPTTAAHVMYDLNGKISLILDGGSCQVGVESTVVDGLSTPPAVLRPGGVSIDEIRACEGWADVVKGYKDQNETGGHAPRAPGMKYKHYSPKAKVVLYDSSSSSKADSKKEISLPIESEVERILAARNQNIPYLGYEDLGAQLKIGIIGTKTWGRWAGFESHQWTVGKSKASSQVLDQMTIESEEIFEIQQGKLWVQLSTDTPNLQDFQPTQAQQTLADIYSFHLGGKTKNIAHGLFSALRDLDQRGVDVIYVEGIDDEGDIAAAVMNRLRKAASVFQG